jgi:hypothetical protein
MRMLPVQPEELASITIISRLRDEEKEVLKFMSQSNRPLVFSEVLGNWRDTRTALYLLQTKGLVKISTEFQETTHDLRDYLSKAHLTPMGEMVGRTLSSLDA